MLRLIIPGLFCWSFALAADAPPRFDAKLAARYLDERATWWASWQNAARDHDTFCISCHTVLPYALGRPALHRALGESRPAVPEERILQNVRKRVELWSDVQPFYSDKSGAGKTGQSRNTEAVLNALILSDSDRRSGVFTPEAKRALDNMLEMQLTEGASAGAWTWLDFRNQPWEAEDSSFMGTALAMVAVGNAPEEYRHSAAVRNSVKSASAYLSLTARSQSLLNRTMLLWASARVPVLLTDAQKRAIVTEVSGRQAADGGWKTANLIDSGWKRRDGSEPDVLSDGYITALLAYVLQLAGPSIEAAPTVKRALSWLAVHQDQTTGQIPASSMNLKRDPQSDRGRFMSDAATAYAALAFDLEP